MWTEPFAGFASLGEGFFLIAAGRQNPAAPLPTKPWGYLGETWQVETSIGSISKRWGGQRTAMTLR